MSKTLAINQVRSTLGWDYENIVVPGNTINAQQFAFVSSLTNGTGANQADLLYVAQLTIAASGTSTLILTASLVDFFGATLTFARIKAMHIQPDTTNLGSSILIGGSATPFITWCGDVSTSKLRVRKGGCFQLYAPDATGYPVVASTADHLQIVNEDGSNPFIVNIAFVGCSV